MKIKQSVINTFDRIGFDYKSLINDTSKVIVHNRFTGDNCETTPLIKELILWVYDTNDNYDKGIKETNLSDFDRIRYFVLEVDSNAYSTCLD